MNFNEFEDPYEQLSCVPVHLLFIDWFPLFWWFLWSKLSLDLGTPWIASQPSSLELNSRESRVPRIEVFGVFLENPLLPLSPMKFLWSFAFWVDSFCGEARLYPKNLPANFEIIWWWFERVIFEITSSSRAGTLLWAEAVWPVGATGLTGQEFQIRPNRSDRSGLVTLLFVVFLLLFPLSFLGHFAKR